MCLIVLAHQHWPGYPLVVAANRDEFYQRPTAPAQYWQSHPQLLAGRDLEQGGTWLGITRSGRFAAVTNVRDINAAGAASLSRGQLTTDFLTGQMPAENYLQDVHQHSQDYGAFNLLLGDGEQLWYYSNRLSQPPQALQPGLYGLSNAALNTPWPKVELAKTQMQAQIAQGAPDCERLATAVANEQLFAPQRLSESCQAGDLEHLLSAQFIHTDSYGTRACTTLWLDDRGNGRWREARFDRHAKLSGCSEEQLSVLSAGE